MPLIAWAAIALVASFVLTALLVKPPPTPQASTLDDFETPQIEDGTPHAVVFGEGWLEGWQVLWYGNFRTTKIKAPSKK